MQTTTDHPAPSIRRMAPGLLAGLLAAAVYVSTVRHGFVYDDAFILRSPFLGRPWDVLELWSDGFFAKNVRYMGVYRPLGQWSQILNASLSKALTGSLTHPMPFHAVNVLLHSISSGLVFVWLARLPLSRWIAGVTALLWAVHPVHAEVVASIWNRYETLSCLFGLLFLIAFRSQRHLLAAPLFLSALWCKESAIAFLPLALLVDALFPEEGRRFRVRRWILPLAATALWFALRAHALRLDSVPVPYVENPAAAVSPLQRVWIASHVQLLYLRDQILPLWLSTDHSFAEIRNDYRFADVGVWSAIALVGAALGLAWRCRRTCLEITLAIAGYALLLAPVSNFIVPIGTVMADRLVYLPSICFCLLIARGLSIVRPGALRIATVGILILAGSILSSAQARIWKDELSLFREQVRTAPRSAKSHGNYADALRVAGQPGAAIPEYRASIAIFEDRPEPHAGLALAYEAIGEDPEKIIQAWSDAMRYGTLAPRQVRVPALRLIDLGRWERVTEIRDRLAAEDPQHPLLVNLDSILRAADTLLRAPATTDEFAAAQESFRRGDWGDARTRLHRALHRRQVSKAVVPDALGWIADCHERLGEPRKAPWFRELASAVRAEGD